MTFFSYYGAKSKLAHLYDAPEYDLIIEPFAGAANYSLRYYERQVFLVEKDPRIAAIWRKLILADPDEVIALPEFKQHEEIVHADPIWRDYIALNSQQGMSYPPNVCGKWNGWANKKLWVAKNLHRIRHWQVIESSYERLDNGPATWFIDPPYVRGGERYKQSSRAIDFKSLGTWCKERIGHVIVCENDAATWLPFRPLVSFRGMKHRRTEVVWTKNDS